MTTLLLHACQYRRCKPDPVAAQGRRQQAALLHRQRLAAAAAAVRRPTQPELAAFAHYFAQSCKADQPGSRYTSALAADLPSPATSDSGGHCPGCDMSAADTQTAPFSQQQHPASVIRSYSDPDLPGNARRHHQVVKCHPTSSSAAEAATSAAHAGLKPEGPTATFVVAAQEDPESPPPTECPVSFRHSFDCLLDIDSLADPVVLASPWPTARPPAPPPLPLLPAEPTSPPPTQAPTPSSPTPLRKVSSCGSTLGARPKKRVQFADEVGKQLRHIRIFSEPSCAPPRLTIKSGLPSEDAEDDTGSPQSGVGGGCGGGNGSNFKCQFAQPSSKYILFRENVEKNCVSLSNLYFDELTAKGCVAVKNIGFDKRVFVRVTFDQWTTHRDVEATYASSQDARQDMFVFSLQCPAECERGFEFCVCYEVGGQTFWDSNAGANYKVSAKVSKSRKPTNGFGYTSDYKPNFSEVTDFSEFSVWEHFSDRVYY